MTDTKLSGEAIRAWREHPARMVRDLFKVEPDQWQEEALEAFPHSPRLCLKACVGPGKTAVLAWIAWNFLLTRPEPICGATSITGDNLKANLWTELARWREKSPLLLSTFEQTKSEIFLKQAPKTWRLEARTWPKDADAAQIGNALAGIHAKHVLWLADESGAYPESIMPIMEGIFAGDPIEAHIVQAGNPLMLHGPLYRACTVARKLWKVIEITGDPDDPKRSPRISLDYARQQIQQYGRQNPWVLVRIFGQFPPSSINALIGPDDIAAAIARRYRVGEFDAHPRIISVDVAREGDDASVVFQRQGLQSYTPMVYRNIDGTQGANHVARLWREWEADACFVDNTGGFGSSWVDNLVRLHFSPIPVHYSEKSSNPRYYNKRTEMAFDCIDWVKRGGAIPDVPELGAAMTQTTYTFQGDKLILEPKDAIKIKLGYSPDHFDALMTGFAAPVEKVYRGPTVTGNKQQGHQVEYDPFSRDRVLPGGQSGGHQSEYVYDPRR